MKTPWFFRLVLIVLSLVFAGVIVEIALRIMVPGNTFDARLHMRPYVRREIRSNMRGVSPVSRFTTNRLGLRGADLPPENMRRGMTSIVTVGGSTTECFYLDDAKTWPAVLGAGLERTTARRVWVGNGGLDGHSTSGHLVFFDKVVRRIRPDIVIVLAGINDLGYSLQDRGIDRRHFESADWKYWLMSRSRLFQIAYLWKQILFDRVTVVDSGAHGDFVERRITEESPLPADIRAALPSLAPYRENLKKLIREARAMGITAVFLTQPMLFENTPRWRETEGAMYWLRGVSVHYSAATYWRMLNEFNREMMSVCREEGAPCFDLASVVPHDREYFYDGCHLTEKGAELVGRKTAEWLVANGIMEGRR